jgi:outer membrane protein assembly factor BamB
MKVQCSCGAKSLFEVTEEMRTHPVQFCCPACGLDASGFVDSLVRQALDQKTTPVGSVVHIAPQLENSTASFKPVSAAKPQLRITLPKPVTSPAPAALSTLENKDLTETDVSSRAEVAVSEIDPPCHCPKHPSELALENCRVCSKPICPRCMELFGFVCSPLCRAKAASHGIQVPIYQGHKSVIEQRRWGKIVWFVGTTATLSIAAIAIWIWYTWFGLLPKQVLSIRFPEPSYSGQSAFAGTDQLVFLHGGTLVRHDMRLNKEIWSQYLINKDEIKAEVGREMEQAKALVFKANNEAWQNMPKTPDPEKLSQSLEREAAAALGLWVRGQNVWILSSQKLTRYDWASGKPVQELKLPTNNGGLICRGDELLALNAESGRSQMMSVNLNSCDSRTTELDGQGNSTQKNAPLIASKPMASHNTPKAGLPTGVPGRDAGKPMDPAKVAAQAQNLSLPARMALPAVLANSWSQERMLAELDENPRPRSQAPALPRPTEHFTIFPTGDGYLEFSSHLLERKTIAHSTLKPAPAKSVLEGPVNVTQSTEVANEILNEMQRERGAGVIQEDVSRYAVKLRHSATGETWTGEVVGEPALLPLESVNVLAANKTLIVFDKANRKLWQTTLNFNLAHDFQTAEPIPTYGHGPCVEYKDALYVFDPGVLSAFELKTGNARWRLPSVGITGLFFDDQGMLYVNTTTASPDQIKLSHQIDINQKIISVVLKVAPANGKILWSSQTAGLVHYVSGKFVYTLQSYEPEEEDDNPYRQETGFEKQPYLRIKRLNPKSGREMWEHFQQRAPLDVQFDKNYIRLVFKKEVQVLRSIGW